MADRAESAVPHGVRLSEDELRAEVVSALAPACMVISAIGWWLVVMWFDFQLLPFLAFFVVFLAGAAAYATRDTRPRVARVFLLVGPALGLGLALKSVHSEGVPYFSVVVVVANAAMSPSMAVVAAVLSSLALLVCSAPGANRDLSLLLLWVVTGVECASFQGLHTAMQWAWSSQQRARVLLDRLRDQQGERNRTLAALVEATRRLERSSNELAIARREAEQAREIKAQFAANISHELRTPLNLIIGYSELMTRSPEAYKDVRWTSALRADLREIYKSSRHLLAMVDDILALSRIDAQRLPLRLEPTDLTSLIRETVESSRGLLRSKPVELKVAVPDALPGVLVDRARVRQVLFNLLSNAIRFTDEGSIVVKATVADGEVVVAVTDTGAGIPRDELPTVFEEFRQVRNPVSAGRGGTGLGLAICRQFVRLHGGEIGAESELGRGSTFRFSLPIPGLGKARPGLSYYAPEGWSPPAPENPLGKTAIIVGAPSQGSMRIAGALEGYHSIPVEGLEGLRQRVQTDHPAGIVVLHDPTHAEALDPRQIWHAAGRSDLPVVRCALRSELQTPQELGVAGYLVKPVGREQLVAAIRRACPSLSSLLVVDDDPRFVAFVSRLLRAEVRTCRVRRAYSGEAALQALARQQFDAVVLDLTMPGMDGFQVIHAMQSDSRLATVPIIVISGSSYADELTRSLPVRVELCRFGDCGPTELGRYVTALLDASPPDYSL